MFNQFEESQCYPKRAKNVKTDLPFKQVKEIFDKHKDMQ